MPTYPPIAPSTTTASYLTTIEPNVRFTSIVTVGNALPGGGVFGGIPDGIGAFDNGNGTITVIVNHELSAGQGIAHGPLLAGAFIDRLVIDQATLGVVGSGKAVTTLNLWNDATDSYFTGSAAFSRFCSGDLADSTAFFNSSTGLGTQVRIYLTGEESGPEGRASQAKYIFAPSSASSVSGCSSEKLTSSIAWKLAVAVLVSARYSNSSMKVNWPLL